MKFARGLLSRLRSLDSDAFRVSSFLADGVLAWGVACVYSGFAGPGTPRWGLALNFAAAMAALHALALNYSPRWRFRGVPVAAGLAAVNGSAAAVLGLAGRSPDLAALYLPWLMPLLLLPPQLWLHRLRSRIAPQAPLEPLRLALAFAGSIGVTYPLLTNIEVGTGDSYWYASMVADFIRQWRAGIFPVFVGQSIFAFNGTPSPVRLAPYLQHVCGIMDFATGHVLSAPGVLNLLLFLSFLGGVLSAYACLVAIEARARWLALMIALLYLAAPAPLALLYTGNLYMSVCTLPYLPVVLLGLQRSDREPGVRSFLLLAVGMAALWICHPPIALWATVIVAGAQLPRLFSRPKLDVPFLRAALVALGAFAVLTLFTFVSNLGLQLSSGAVERFLILQSLQDSFRTALLPVSEAASAPTDHQLGWSLWALLLAGLAGVAITRQRWLLGLAIGALAILLFVVPVPGLLDVAWKALPQAVVNISFYWPTQRFYLLLSATAAVLCYGAWAGLVVRRAWTHATAAVLLLFALHWSGVEASYFVQNGLRRTTAPGTGRAAHRPANEILTRYAFNLFPLAPPYFSHGYIDPLWENRILASEPSVELASNYAAAVGPAATVRAEGEITAQDLGSGYYMLLDQLPLLPRRRYSLEFSFAHPELTGTFLGESKTLIRTYDMPDSGIGLPFAGKPTGFGSLPSSKKAMSLANDSSQEDAFRVQFVANAPVTADIKAYGRYVLREYDPATLPVRVESWTPYRAHLEAAPAGAAWLETPRFFLPGYRAVVNGRSAPVARSPGGLVMVAIPPGGSQVELTYPGPLSLRLCYYVSLFGWVMVAGIAVLLAWRRFSGGDRAGVPPAAA